MLPIAAHVSTEMLVYWNVLGAVFAFTLVLALLGKHIEAMRRRNLVEWTTELRHLDSAEFEYLVGEVFRRVGLASTRDRSSRRAGRQHRPRTPAQRSAKHRAMQVLGSEAGWR